MKIEQITFTRFLAAISIVIFHFGLDVFPFNSQYIDYLFSHATAAVSYFFVLSGFVMIIAYQKNNFINASQFYKNRLARIYPVYSLAIILLFIIQLIQKINIDYYGMLLNLIGIQAWIPSKVLSFNSPGWSLSVEFLFYALFPILFNKIYNVISFKKLAMIFILFFVTSQIIFYFLTNNYLARHKTLQIHSLVYYFPMLHLNEFLMGNLAGFIYCNFHDKNKRNYDWYIIGLIAILVFVLKCHSYFKLKLDFHNGLLSLIYVPFLLLISLNNGILTKIFKTKIFILLGEISFSIYILQIPIYSFISFACRHLNIKSKTNTFYISLITLVTIAAFVYKHVELPLRDKIKNWTA